MYAVNDKRKAVNEVKTSMTGKKSVECNEAAGDSVPRFVATFADVFVMAPTLRINRVSRALIVITAVIGFFLLHFHLNYSQTVHLFVSTALTVAVISYFMRNAMSANGSTFCDENFFELIGVKLLSETFDASVCDHTSNKSKRCIDCSNTEDGDVIGFVSFDNAFKNNECNPRNMCLHSFRNRIREQVQPLPKNFNFVSKQGWPVSVHQESSILLNSMVNNENVVQIQRSYDKPKFGIVTMKGDRIGFIFIDFNDSVSSLRNSMLSNFKHSLNVHKFLFVDKNRWPVAEEQEEFLTVWDLERNRIITIVLNIEELKGKDVSDGVEGEVDDFIEHDTESPIRVRHSSGATTKSLSALTDTSFDKDFVPIPVEITTSISGNGNGYKPVLISYVRQEAERHARQLKLRLEDLGCQVFLDIDEIKGGHDWQDALNQAVVNCSIFVPLITPLYGLTQWTNREVKLADIKSKVIIPVNFLDYWPPECLAIQFASTQYLDWKTKIEIEEALLTQGDRARDIRYWDEPYVQRTAEEIVQRFVAVVANNGLMERSMSPNTNHHFALSAVPQAVIQEDVVDKIEEIKEVSLEQEIVPQTSTLVESVAKFGKSVRTLFRSSASPVRQMPSIVISAHPKERNFVEILRRRLQDLGFDVWCSTDMCIGTSFEHVGSDLATIDDTSPLSPVCHSLPIIPSVEDKSDDNVFSTHNGSFMIPEITEESPTQLETPSIKPVRPRFLDMHSLSIIERRSSQSSEINGSQNSLFTPEDLDKAKQFKRKVNKARMVIVVFSSAFVNSKTCKSQIFYCDYRKTVIPIIYEECHIGHCLMKLIGADLLKRDSASENDDESFLNLVVSKVNCIINASKEAFKAQMKDAKILSLCKHLSKRIPVNDKKKTVIFVTGGSKFYNTSSEAVCTSIAQMLAAKDNVILVTSGFYGVAETVGRHFYEYREQQRNKSNSNLGLFHILPRKHPSDLHMKCRQQQDRSFEVLPFGETVFIGDSLPERDAVMARIFHYCILIEGGPYSANLAKEFIWNDNTVIPIMSTGGAASGQYDCTAKITEMPACVDESDWKRLGEKDNTADETASAVLRVINNLVEWRRKNCVEKKMRPCFRGRRRFHRSAKPKNEVVVETNESQDTQ